MQQLMRQLEEEQVKLASWGMNRAFLLKTCCILATRGVELVDQMASLEDKRLCLCWKPSVQPPSSVYGQREYLSEIMYCYNQVKSMSKDQSCTTNI